MMHSKFIWYDYVVTLAFIKFQENIYIVTSEQESVYQSYNQLLIREII